MLIITTLIGIIGIFLGLIVFFQEKKNYRKFQSLKAFTDRLEATNVTRLYCGTRKKAGMIVVRLCSAQPFTSLVAFELTWKPAFFGGRGVEQLGSVDGLHNVANNSYEAYFVVYVSRTGHNLVFPHTGSQIVKATFTSLTEILAEKHPIQKWFTLTWLERLGLHS